MTPPDFMAALYAGVTAIEEGKLAEVEVEHRVIDEDGDEVILTVIARREVRPYARMGDL